MEWTYRSTPSGWECPRCHRVYGPGVIECAHCRLEAEGRECSASAAGSVTVPGGRLSNAAPPSTHPWAGGGVENDL